MTIRTFFDETVASAPARVAVQYREKENSAILSRTYAEFAVRVRQVAELAGALGIAPRQAPVALILENCPQWLEIYLGLTGCATTVVPIDPKLHAAEVTHVLLDSGACAVFTDSKHSAMLVEILPGLPAMHQVVLLDAAAGHLPAVCAGRPCHAYETAIAAQADAAASPASRYAREFAYPGDVASLIYTSGTTGQPKGAMLTHANICADADGALSVIAEIGSLDRFLIVLPLFHAFSFTANFIVPLRARACMQFVKSLRNVSDDMRAFSPTILMAVPLLADKLYARIEDRIRRNPLARLLLLLGLRNLVARSVRRGLGGSLRLIVSGGAPGNKEVLEGLRGFGLPTIEGYG
ncbi:MAG: AMP-binding protein, partial [Kiritimatiellae bacterium]|nr:AMP-binding protein [Kiritimatiellia bacterium]